MRISIDSIRYLGEILTFGEDTKKVPGNIKRVEDTPLLEGTLVDELKFESVQEFESKLVFGTQGFLTNDTHH